MVKRLLEESYTRLLEKQVADAVASPELLGNRVFSVLVLRALRAKDLQPQHRGVIKAFWANAVWTRDRLIKSGLAVEVTLHHRLWWCECVSNSRQEVVDSQFVADARAAGPEDSFFNRGLLAFPQCWPKPLEEGGVVFTKTDLHQNQQVVSDPRA